MTYSEDLKKKIISLKEAGLTFRQIGIAIGKSRDAVKAWWNLNRVNLHLPPKVKVSKKKPDGRVGLEIKRIVRETPSSSISDIRSKLFGYLDADTPCPSRTTIGRTLSLHSYKMIKLQKKPLISDDLIDQIFQIWDEIDLELYQKLSNSTQKSFEKVIRLMEKY